MLANCWIGYLTVVHEMKSLVSSEITGQYAT